MLIIAAVLAVVMGVTLGLLGGGGSILAVPLLVYVVGLDAKEAIATSLVVVGATSFAATILHARAGNVRWKRGLMFGGFAMAGAWVGGFAARWVPGPVLLALFGAMMVVAGIAMLRQRKEHVPNGPAPIFKTALEGLFVGAVTGLVGAGGGFIVVPALVLLGGLDMRSAVGTSALV
ncbi:MAG: putative membrane protein YfcA, partial [Myxococcota bacterium]